MLLSNVFLYSFAALSTAGFVGIRLVGWVEQRETHHSIAQWWVSLSLYPSYTYFIAPKLYGNPPIVPDARSFPAYCPQLIGNSLCEVECWASAQCFKTAKAVLLQVQIT